MAQKSKPATDEWLIPITPAERWELFSIVFHKDRPPKKGQQGRIERRCARKFGLGKIYKDHADARDGDQFNFELRRSAEPSLFSINVEARNWLRDLMENHERQLATDMALGELLDVIEELREGQAYKSDVQAPRWNPDEEAWVSGTERSKLIRDARIAIQVANDDELGSLKEIVDEVMKAGTARVSALADRRDKERAKDAA